MRLSAASGSVWIVRMEEHAGGGDIVVMAIDEAHQRFDGQLTRALVLFNDTGLELSYPAGSLGAWPLWEQSTWERVI